MGFRILDSRKDKKMSRMVRIVHTRIAHVAKVFTWNIVCQSPAASWLREKSFPFPSILLIAPDACMLRRAFYLPIIFLFSRPTAQVRSSTTMKLFFPLFAAAIAAPVSAEFYLKEQFNDDVSFTVM